MKKTIFLLALASAGYASALEPGEYKNYTNEEAGGLLAVAPGEHVTVTDVTVHSGGTVDVGGAVYVDEGATFEIKGNSTFYDNYEYVTDFEDLQGGLANDVYLADDATLVLNAGEGKTVVLGSGVESFDNSAQLIKQGQGTAVLGGWDTSDCTCFGGQIDVQEGEMLIKTDVNAFALSVSSGAGLQIQDNSLMLCANPGAINALDVNAEGTEMSLSNVSGTLTELSALEEGTPGLISGGVINIGKKNYTVSDISLQNSELNINATGCVLTGIAMDAGSTIKVNESNGSATLSGENSLLLGGLTYDVAAWVSTQLSGVTLADDVTLTLGLTGEQLAEMEVEFTVELKDVTVADGASLTLTTGSLGDTSTGLTIVSWTQGSTSLLVEMQQSSLVVPEPATATLSLLALAALAARRRREM